MDPVSNKLLTIYDRLAHHSTSDQDALQTVRGLRRVVKGEMPSTLLKLETDTRPKSQQLASLKRQVAQLRAEKAELESVNDELQGDHDRLKLQVESLRAGSSTPHHTTGADYSYCEVMVIVRDKFGKQNGGLTLWAEYSAELHTANPESPLIRLSKLQTWRLLGWYPHWAVAQLLGMPVVSRVAYKWSEEDNTFLCETHLADPQKTDDQLAVECSIRFGWPINTNMIKSKFHALRRQGRIPMLRPAKSR